MAEIAGCGTELTPIIFAATDVYLLVAIELLTF